MAIKVKRSSEADASELMEKMLKMMEKQSTQQAQVMSQLLVTINSQAEAQKAWFELFKPQQTPTRSTSPAEREALRDEAGMWTELDMQKQAQFLAKELLSPATGDDEDGVF